MLEKILKESEGEEKGERKGKCEEARRGKGRRWERRREKRRGEEGIGKERRREEGRGEKRKGKEVSLGNEMNLRKGEESTEEGKGKERGHRKKRKYRASLIPTFSLWLMERVRLFQNDVNNISMLQKGHRRISGLCSGKSFKEIVSDMNLDD